jgi:hypothetical protein
MREISFAVLDFVRSGVPRTRSPKRACAVDAVHLLFLLLSLTIPALVATGCSSSSSLNAKAGPINFVGSGGASAKVSTLGIASSVKLSMMPTGDSVNAGVDWEVSCGGNPVTGSVSNGACGTLSPAHTLDGAATTYTAPSIIPIAGSVTITATVTSNPSQSSSVSLTIVASPIGVALSSPAPVPDSLLVNATLNFSAVVTNDPSSAGVVYTATCGSPACGSFNPSLSVPGGTGSSSSYSVSSTYTAPSVVPAGGTVTIIATSLTDTTKSASMTFTITAPPPVVVSIVPSTLYVETTGAAHSRQITAIVANDPQMAGVDWSVQCAGQKCGAVTPTHTASGTAVTYVGPATVPSGGSVTITASSTTNPSVSASSTANIVTTAPILVTMSAPPPPSLTTGTQATLVATTTGDPGNLGVVWTATCGSAGACGSFSLSPASTPSGGQIVYTAPASVPAGGGLITITAASPATTPADSAVAFTTIVAQPPSITFVQSPPATQTASTQAPVSASVANDVAPGGVSWSVQCSNTIPGGCGWVTPAQTASGATAYFTAPPVTTAGTSVTITATSVADPTVSVSANPVTINPATTLAVNFIPSLPAQVQPNGSVNLTAAVANDATNAGIDWQVCASGCGFFTITPAIPAVPATPTTPYVPAKPAVTATSVSGWSNGLPILYTAPSQIPAGGSVAVVARAHANSAAANSGTIQISNAAGGPALSGLVQAGLQVVTGSTVSLYAAGTSGYASAAALVATATTDKNGQFTIPAGYACPSPASQMYLVAEGGSVGSNSANPNLAMMTALGNCSNLGSAAVVVNEVTTVASAFATAPFAANDALSGNLSYLYLGTSSGNSSGLGNAFATVNNLVDITTGLPRYMVPSSNAAVPFVEINTLADTLNACTASAGGAEGDGSPCGSLFTATDVLSQHSKYNSVAPSDTLQAAFNIAQHPITNFGYQLNLPSPGSSSSLATSTSPFQPTLAANPNDWSLSLNYTGGGGLSAASIVGSFAVDSGGNLWITDTAAGSVIEWNPAGAAISPSTGYAAGGGPIAIDASGNVWISGNGFLDELTSLGTPAAGSPFGGVVGGGSDMSFDGQGNLWIANGGGVSEFNNLGVALSPAGGFTNSGISGIDAIGVDSSNNVWVGLSNTTQAFAELSNPGGQLVVAGGTNSIGNVFPQLAADGAGNMWAVSQLDVCKVPPYAGKGSQYVPSCNQEAESAGDYSFYNAEGIAVDGSAVVWLASAGGGNLSILPSVLPILSNSSSVQSNQQGYLASPSLAAGPLRVAVDGSGNLWVLLANQTVTEYVGVATPGVTPTALAVKNKKLGAKP